MLSFQKVDHQNILQDGATLRGSPLLSHIQQQMPKYPHLKIKQIHTCEGHMVIMIDDNKMCFLLDYVPESLVSMQSNESASLYLMTHTLLPWNDIRQRLMKSSEERKQMKNCKQNQTQSESSKIEVNEFCSMKPNEISQLLKKNFNRLVNKTTNSNQENDIITSGKEIIEPITIFSEGSTSNSILCFADISSPFVAIFFSNCKWN
jgi:hypothetical protein